MQPDAVQTAPPIALISWWFGKTEEQRCEFMQGDKASERVRQNILAMEEFATRHCYLVSCNTQLAVHPMPPLSSMPSRSQPHAWKGGLWLPCALHAAESIACGGKVWSRGSKRSEANKGERISSWNFARVSKLPFATISALQFPQPLHKDCRVPPWMATGARG
uniref:Uncharacterized protein n=1 Tax=Trypanosoma vivax (strain Y486) TaxID=1055687 RepID=G0U8F6_TRYVY|nr:conserved hypothetical protein [Trypanosoma vivax Y486]